MKRSFILGHSMTWKDGDCRLWLFQKDFQKSKRVQAWMEHDTWDASYELVFGLSPESKPPILGEQLTLKRGTDDVVITVESNLTILHVRRTSMWKWYCLVSVGC